MQKASAAYKKAMKQPIRNRAYINARIGIVSSVAQNNVVAECWVAETTKDLLESRIFNLGTLLDPDNRYAI